MPVSPNQRGHPHPVPAWVGQLMTQAQRDCSKPTGHGLGTEPGLPPLSPLERTLTPTESEGWVHP